jgi:hypothetical protein
MARFSRRSIASKAGDGLRCSLAPGKEVAFHAYSKDLAGLYGEGGATIHRAADSFKGNPLRPALDLPALLERPLRRATALIWLDIPWEVCREGLLARGQRRGGTEAEFSELLKWAQAYWDRQTPTSFKGHQRLFEAFSGTKLRIQSRKKADQLLADLTGRRNPS